MKTIALNGLAALFALQGHRAFDGIEPTGTAVHYDRPLSDLAVRAFDQPEEMYVGARLFPMVEVGQKSDTYYTIPKDAFFRVPDTLRAPRTAPRRVNFTVSTDAYMAKNYALATDNAKEDLANQDRAIQLRENGALLVTGLLALDQEVRIANKVTSGSNVGSYVAVQAADKWSVASSANNPMVQVMTAHAFIRRQTGLTANTMVIDYDTYQNVRKMAQLIEYFKYVDGGLLSDNQLKQLFEVENIWVARAIKNTAPEGSVSATMANVWGNNVLLAHVRPPAGVRTVTAGLRFRWASPELPTPFAIRRYDDPDPGKGIEVIDAQYHQDEKIVARDLTYLLSSTL